MNKKELQGITANNTVRQLLEAKNPKKSLSVQSKQSFLTSHCASGQGVLERD